MTDWFYSCAYSLWGDEEQEAIKRVHASGRYTMGVETEAFEHEFAEFHGRKYGVMVNSGSSANLIAVAALFHKQDNPLRRGDKAVVPALAWSTTYAPLVQHGLDLELIDVDGSWNLDTSKPVNASKLAVVVPILGNPIPFMKRIRTTLDTYECYLIEDNCESIGAWYGPLGEKSYTGTYGIMSTFSFFYSHQLSAIEGGMVLTDDPELFDLLRMLRAHGWTRDIAQAERSFEDEYDFRLFGYNVRPLELHAAIARAQLLKLEDFRKQRQMNYNNFTNLCIRLPVRFQDVARNAVPNPFGMAFTLESKDVRAKLVSALRSNGIDCRLPTGGSFRRHAYGRPWSNQSTPNADFIHDCGLFLGNAPFDISPQIERAVKVMRETL